MKLRLLTALEPTVAVTSDVGDSGASTQIVGVYNSFGHPVTSLDGLPDAAITAEPVNGDGALTGTTRATVGQYYQQAVVTRNFFDTQFVDQVNYTFTFAFTQAGTYRVTVDAAQLVLGIDPTPSVFKPLVVTCKVTDPLLYVEYNSPAENQDEQFRVGVVREVTQAFRAPLRDPFDELTASPSVGISVTVTSGPADGVMPSLASEPIASIPMSDGMNFIYSFQAADVHFVFSRRGIYHLTATELMSPEGLSFDPGTAVPVATTKPLELTIDVGK